VFWNYLSTFWNYLSDKDVDIWENFWNGLGKMSSDLIVKVGRFVNVTALINQHDITDYYDIKIGPLYSKPTDLDPTDINSNNIIKPLGTVVLEPINGLFYDFIEITPEDYYRIRSIGENQYIVIGNKYFKINLLMSSEEPEETSCSIEINSTINKITQDDIGKFGIKAQMDASDFKIFIQQGTVSEVTWHDDGIEIIVDPGDTVNDIITLANSKTGKWGKLYSKSTQPNVPILNYAIDTYPNNAYIFSELPEFIEFEEANERFYPPEIKTWNWYEGYNSFNGTEDNGYYTYDKLKYMIKINGSLAYLENNPFNFYLTNAKVYKIDENVVDILEISNYIDKSEDGITLIKDQDFIFYNNTLELFNDIEIEDTFYCKTTPIIEDYMYEMYGALVDINRWKEYNYNNISGKAAIHGLMKFNQNLDDMEKALNVYYGLPIAPEKCKVIGLYESYGYKITVIDGNNITLDIINKLSPFAAEGCEMMNESIGHVKILEVVDRLNGIIRLEDSSGLSIGDLLYLKLVNKNKIISFYQESISVYSDQRMGYFNSNKIGYLEHMIDIMHAKNRYPEILVYGSEIDGIYHVLDVIQDSEIATLIICGSQYNDYIPFVHENVNAGYVHLLWPTHKFLYLLLESGVYYKAYLDAPIDTIYDTDDKLEKFDIIARNVSMKKFSGWEEFNYFRRQSGINLDADLLEMISAIPGAEFGKYFPSEQSQTKYYI